jgi:hypothetical protein
MGAANTHLTHLEELVLTQGSQGYDMARAFLLELLETLKGNSDSAIQTSVKWDGAPAIFAGVNPDNNKFFVGTKSIFNKVPKINYTEEDIIKNHGHAPGLVDKLTRALTELPKLGIKNILQGDFMFDDSMLDVISVDGEPHYRFKPNTIVYAVPVNSNLGQEIGQSKFGIVFHTTYDSLDSGARFGADVSGLNEVPGVWFDDAFFTDDTGTVTLTQEEEERVISLVKNADIVNESINYSDLPMAMLNIYINSEIKAAEFIEDPERSFDGFASWYTARSDTAIEKLKTERGRQRKRAQQVQTLQMFESRREDILNLFQVSRLLFEAKNIFIEKYNNAVYNTKHFVDDGSGDLVATNPEGYVAVDRAGNGVKFVDRLEFSRANFMVDKSSKFVQESLFDFTIQISKTKQITKTISEWLREIKCANHTFQKPSQFVYKDILDGVPIVEIVSQQNAQETIYNAIINYVNENFMNDEYNSDPHPPPLPVMGEEPGEIDLEFENEDEDPVVDVQIPKTYAIVPGAFKPPHRGHADMVRRYATGDGVPQADEVIVIISAPQERSRTLRNGKAINEKHAIKMWHEIFPDIANLDNVRFEVGNKEMRSPVTLAYNYIGNESPIPFNKGDRVVLGASRKDDDWKRWRGAEKYVKKDLNTGDPEIELLSGEKYAVPPLARSGGNQDLDNKSEPTAPVNFSATSFRELISDLIDDPNDGEAYKNLIDFIPEDKIDVLFSILDLEPPTRSVRELSGAGGGVVGAPMLKRTIDNDEDNIKKEFKDNVTIDEIMRLIIEKGIVR